MRTSKTEYKTGLWGDIEPMPAKNKKRKNQKHRAKTWKYNETSGV